MLRLLYHCNAPYNGYRYSTNEEVTNFTFLFIRCYNRYWWIYSGTRGRAFGTTNDNKSFQRGFYILHSLPLAFFGLFLLFLSLPVYLPLPLSLSIDILLIRSTPLPFYSSQSVLSTSNCILFLISRKIAELNISDSVITSPLMAV